ncbi:MAG TPA: zinc-ribbon domain-containing protein, partial [Eoetvoesiella sp.]
MDLTTRCPQCGSTFQASLDQLQLRKGYIRCIHCAHIFDGYEAVVPAAGVPAGASASDASSADRDAPVKGPRIVRPRLTEGAHETAAWPEVRIPKFTISSGTPGNPESLEEPVISARPPVDHAHRITPRAEPVIGAGRSIPTAARRPDQQAASEPVYVPDAAVGASSQVYAEPREARYSGDQQSLPEFLDKQFTRRRGAARVFWSVLVLIGLCAILAQVV